MKTPPTTPSNPSLLNNWMGGYAVHEGYFDEFLEGDGTVRPHWKAVSRNLGRLSKDDWSRRERQLQQLIHDHGITYNVYDDQAPHLRPWSVDMLPLALPQLEFDKLEVALSQRAHLLNLILQDVYGRQTTLNGGKMHPYLVLANPSFLRPCHGLLPPRAQHIHLYAADLSRAPDGSWWVLSDRVEAASGLGYALENRSLLSRVFPKAIWESEALSLQPFIQAFCRHIESLAPRHADNPNVALLTPGPGHETYFEQSFLARNLGYTLAEGADLTVRNNRLYMKTIGGVQPIDVLLRRVDSSWTDPLELRNDSMLGVPGLVNAVRQGNLALANGLGSGFVETPAMLAFLPWFCRNFLGESLDVPSVATWWCGQPSERKHVLENIGSLVIKPTFWSTRQRSHFGPLLSSKEKEELASRIRAHPESYCGQEIVSNATVPVCTNGRMESRHFQMRVFMVPKGGGWTMLPGGFARYAAREDDPVVSMQSGGHSKDTWALRAPNSSSGRRVNPPTPGAPRARRNANDLPSRTADNLFWLGRYIERAEGQARLLRTLYSLLIDEMGTEAQLDALPFLAQIAPPGSNPGAFEKDGRLDFERAEALVVKSIFSLDEAESLVSNIFYIERAAAKVKERLSTDTWRHLQSLRDLGGSRSLEKRSVFDDATLDMLDSTLGGLASLAGTFSDNMTRSQGWRFLQIGRRIERGLAICFLLESAFDKPTAPDDSLLFRLVDWADSSITYRRRYLNAIESRSVLDLLCFDESNPRGLAFQSQSIRELLHRLPHSRSEERHPLERVGLQIYSRVGLCESESLAGGYSTKQSKSLVRFFELCRRDLTELSRLIEQTYFAHTAPLEKRKTKPILR